VRSSVTSLAPCVLVAVTFAFALGACAGKPLPLPTAPPVTLEPSRTVPPPSAAPSLTPAAGQAAVDALRTVLSDPKLSYRAAIKGDVLMTVSDLAVTGSLAASGPDVSSSITYTFDYGEKDTVETRLVGGKEWTRLNKGGWKARKVDEATVVEPFAGALAAGAIADGGPKTVGGKALHELRIRGGRLLDLTTVPAVNLTDERMTSAMLTILVDASGTPVSGHWMQRGQGRVSNQLQEVDVDVDLTFSGVGS
jgi:hypothetical protein